MNISNYIMSLRCVLVGVSGTIYGLIIDKVVVLNHTSEAIPIVIMIVEESVLSDRGDVCSYLNFRLH